MKAAVLLLCMLLMGCVQAQPADYALHLQFEGGGHCSGTAVGPDLVLTATHCFGRLVAINGEEAYALKIVKSGEDHALVRVSAKFDRWAQMGPPPRVGDAVQWIGSPAVLRNVYRRGYVVLVDDRHVLIDAPVFGGDSGSGVFNDRGEVVGVLSGYLVWHDPRSGLQFSMTMLFPLRLTADDWAAIR